MRLPLPLLAGLLGLLSPLPAAAASPRLLLEAESFRNPGGWSLDTQFIEIMGSPYLLAHGLGQPVADATTTATLPAAGKYRVWVRTKDWVAHWGAPGTPGRFQVLVNGQPLAETFGTKGKAWSWHDGGVIEATGPSLAVTLRDLTGLTAAATRSISRRTCRRPRRTTPRRCPRGAKPRSACRPRPRTWASLTWWSSAAATAASAAPSPRPATA